MARPRLTRLKLYREYLCDGFGLRAKCEILIREADFFSRIHLT